MTDEPTRPPRPKPGHPDSRYDRDSVEFVRSTAFFDATYALASTLLVTTLDPGPNGWATWSGLYDAIGNQLIAFAISFALVARYWWLNHTFVASLRVLSPRVIGGIVASLAFVVLLPFTTEGMAEGSTIATVVYAVNVALISLSAAGLRIIAARQDLYLEPPDAGELRLHLLSGAAVAAVFLASIPVAVLIDPGLAKWTWALLLPIGRLIGRAQRRRDAARPLPDDSPEWI